MEIERISATMQTNAQRIAALVAVVVLMNVKLAPELLKSERNLKDLAGIIRAYFALGAFHVQFNVISTETLRKAQEHPEDYRDMLVRVAGLPADLRGSAAHRKGALGKAPKPIQDLRVDMPVIGAWTIEMAVAANRSSVLASGISTRHCVP